jgi:hypothetical protein
VTRVLARFTPKRGIQIAILICLIMFAVAAAFVLLTVSPEQMAGDSGLGRISLWLVVVFCPVYAVDTAARIIRRTPTVVATEEGLVFRSLAGFTEPIPWGEIEVIGPAVMGKKLYLAIQLKNPRASFARLGAWGRLVFAKSHAQGVPNITFRAIHLGVNPMEAAELLERIRVEQMAGGPKSTDMQSTIG